MKTMLEAAKAAKFSVTALTTDQKNAALEAMAQALIDNQDTILAANAMDIENATGKVPQVMLDRLLLTPDRIAGMAKGIREVAALPDPASDPASAAEQQEAVMGLYARLHRLQEPYKEVFLLRALGQLSFRQIGELFGKTENWACVTYHRARQKLQKEDDK